MAATVYAEGVVPSGINRIAITGCVILAVIMQALDTTIANVALPHMQGSVAASAEQINWVLTSYIVAAAIMTPPSGYLTSRFGRKRILLISVGGFIVTSMLCGAAQSLTEIVLYRLLQGCFGAALVPIAQGILLDIFSLKERGAAMGAFGVAVMVGPVAGPVVGGWLTDNFNWRWIFYINLPLGALQIFLDRGSQLDWFSSLEILLEAVVAASAFYIFIVHIFTAKNPFVNPKLFLDRNYAVGVTFIFIIGISYLASMALMTPYLQSLMGYPIVTAGLVMGPRGLGTMLCMFVVGRLMGKVDNRLLLLIGLGLTAWSMYAMTGWTPAVSEGTIAWVGFVQGAGLGFLFVPLTTITFATLPPQNRGEAAGMYNLSRNTGAAVGISIVSYLLTRNMQVNHATIAEHVNPYNRAFDAPLVQQALSPFTAAGRAALDQLVNGQAMIIAYINDFKFLMIAALVAMPLVLLLKKDLPGAGASAPPVAPD